jgi:hypothetical protein
MIQEIQQALMTSFSTAMSVVATTIPKLIGFLVIIFVGWIVAGLLAKTFSTLFRAIKFNDLAKRSGLADFIDNMGVKTDATDFVSQLAKWFVQLIVLVVAFDALGLPAVSDVLRQLVLWLPNLIVSLVILVIGGLGASALSSVVRGTVAKSELGNPDVLANFTRIAVWTFTIVVAVNQIGIAQTILNTIIISATGAIALAVGLSFGLGGRETAKEILQDWYGQMKNSTPKDIVKSDKN